MLVPYRPQFIERIMTDAVGRRFRVIFAVSFINGEVRGHIVSAEEVMVLAGQTAKPLCLSGSCSKEAPEEIISPFVPVASPYFSLEFLINSQPTRAPSHK